MEFEEIIRKRYATKVFDGRKLPDDKVEKLIEFIRLAPTSFNIQPWRVIVIADDGMKEKLAPASWNQRQITTCSHLLVFCANSDVKGNIDRLEKLMIDNGAKADAIKDYIQMMRDFEKRLSDDNRLEWAKRQTFLALGNALNGAKSLGFDSCPMEGFSPSDYSRILALPHNIVPVALCPIGYAADTPKAKLRFPKEHMFTHV